MDDVQLHQHERSDLALDRNDALLLVIDVQDRLASAMPPEARAQMEKNAQVLIRAAKRLLRLYRYAEPPVDPNLAAASSAAVTA